ncbi:regulator of mushroom formation [Schizophyllum commune Tattone D]|nr:regulator of mushroom formation [Schizophyllum commune Tattone D]
MCSPQPPANSVNKGLLLASIRSFEPPDYLSAAISTCSHATKYHLTIVLYSRVFNVDPDCTVNHAAHWDDVQKLLTRAYVAATKAAQDQNKVLMDVDVLLRGINEGYPSNLHGYDAVFRVAGDAIPVHIPAAVMRLPHTYLSPTVAVSSLGPSTPLSTDEDLTDSQFPVVALGGTFDHLHAGHKILLSMAIWIAREKLIVGLTDDALLVRKRYAEVLESLFVRETRLRAFLMLVNPALTYDIVPINDVYGPTGWDENIQALVVSQETESGAQAIATHRAEKGLPALRTFVIDVISPTSHKLDAEDEHALRETKMGSTFIRQWILEQQQRRGRARSGSVLHMGGFVETEGSRKREEEAKETGEEADASAGAAGKEEAGQEATTAAEGQQDAQNEDSTETTGDPATHNADSSPQTEEPQNTPAGDGPRPEESTA